MRRLGALVVLWAGCGRSGFDPITDGGGGGDATVDPSALVKLTVDAPLLDSPGGGSSDCGQFLMYYAGDDTTATNELMPFAFPDDDGVTLWFTFSCKDTDVGWNEALGRWVPPDGAFERLDGRPAQPGENAFVTVDDVMPDGMIATSLRQLRFAFGTDGKLYGTGSRLRADNGMNEVVPVLVDLPTELAASSYQLSIVGAFDPPPAAWAAQTGLGRDIVRAGSTFYLYSTHWDGTSVTATGSALTSIAVAITSDMTTAAYVASPLVTGWSDPMVSAYGGSYLMVARDLASNTYKLVHGTSPTEFDFAGAQALGLAARGGGPGAWDELRYAALGLSGDPRVATARVVGNALYIFYLAGVPPNGGAVPIAKGRRGLGVFRLAL